MDFGKKIMENRSKGTCLEIAEYVGTDTSRFDRLVDTFIRSEGKQRDYLMWAINHTVEKYPAQIKEHLAIFVHLLGPLQTDAVNRGIVRILKDAPVIPEELAGEVYTKCFDLLSDRKQPIAVRAFSIRTLARIGKALPDLKSELVPLFRDIYAFEEKGMHVSAREGLRTLGEKI